MFMPPWSCDLEPEGSLGPGTYLDAGVSWGMPDDREMSTETDHWVRAYVTGPGADHSARGRPIGHPAWDLLTVMCDGTGHLLSAPPLTLPMARAGAVCGPAPTSVLLVDLPTKGPISQPASPAPKSHALALPLCDHC